MEMSYDRMAGSTYCRRILKERWKNGTEPGEEEEGRD